MSTENSILDGMIESLGYDPVEVSQGVKQGFTTMLPKLRNSNYDHVAQTHVLGCLINGVPNEVLLQTLYPLRSDASPLPDLSAADRLDIAAFGVKSNPWSTDDFSGIISSVTNGALPGNFWTALDEVWTDKIGKIPHMKPLADSTTLQGLGQLTPPALAHTFFGDHFDLLRGRLTRRIGSPVSYFSLESAVDLYCQQHT
jgi:hypothetical protein